MLHTTV